MLNINVFVLNIYLKMAGNTIFVWTIDTLFMSKLLTSGDWRHRSASELLTSQILTSPFFVLTFTSLLFTSLFFV